MILLSGAFLGAVRLVAQTRREGAGISGRFGARNRLEGRRSDDFLCTFRAKSGCEATHRFLLSVLGRKSWPVGMDSGNGFLAERNAASQQPGSNETLLSESDHAEEVPLRGLSLE
jgi:hypothetical protein